MRGPGDSRLDQEHYPLGVIEPLLSVLEQRVRALAAENHGLRSRVRILEEELEVTQKAANALESAQGRTLLIREKVERVLQSLEMLKERD